MIHKMCKYNKMNQLNSRSESTNWSYWAIQLMTIHGEDIDKNRLKIHIQMKCAYLTLASSHWVWVRRCKLTSHTLHRSGIIFCFRNNICFSFHPFYISFLIYGDIYSEWRLADADCHFIKLFNNQKNNIQIQKQQQ